MIRNRIAIRATKAQAKANHNDAEGRLINQMKAVLARTEEEFELTFAEVGEIVRAVAARGALRRRLENTVRRCAADRAQPASQADAQADKRLVTDLIAACPDGVRAKLERQSQRTRLIVPADKAPAVNKILNDIGGQGQGNVHNMGYYDRFWNDEMFRAADGAAKDALLQGEFGHRLAALRPAIVQSFIGRPNADGGVFTRDTANAFLHFIDGNAVTAEAINAFQATREGGAGGNAAAGDLNVPYVFLLVGAIMYDRRAAGAEDNEEAADIPLDDCTNRVSTWVKWAKTLSKTQHTVNNDGTVRLTGAVGQKMNRAALGSASLRLFIGAGNTDLLARVFTPTQPRLIRIIGIFYPCMDFHRVLVQMSACVAAGNMGAFWQTMDAMFNYVRQCIDAGDGWYDVMGTQVILVIAKILAGRSSLVASGSEARLGTIQVGEAWGLQNM